MANDNVIRLQLKRGDKWDLVSEEHQLYDGEPSFSRNTTLTGHQYGREVPENYLYIGDTDSTTGFAAFANAGDILTITSKLSREIVKINNRLSEQRDEVELLTDGCFYNKGIISGGALSYSDGTIFMEDTTAYLMSRAISYPCQLDIGPGGRDLDLENDLYSNHYVYPGLSDATDYKKYIVVYGSKNSDVLSLDITDFYYPPEHTPDDFPQNISPFRGLSAATSVRMKNYNYPVFNNSLDYASNALITNNEIYDFYQLTGSFVPRIKVFQMIIVGYITAGGEIYSYYGSEAEDVDFGPYGRTIDVDPTSVPYYQKIELSFPYIKLDYFNNMKNKIIFQSSSDFSWIYEGDPLLPTTVVFDPSTEFKAIYDGGGYPYGNTSLPAGNLIIETNTKADCVTYSILQMNSYKDWPYNSLYIGA